jgi:phosphatidylinositol 4-kinase
MQAKDIVLSPFIYSLDYRDHFDDQAKNMEIPEDQRHKLNSFLSTPKFIKCLTEVSQMLGKMKEVSKEDKLKILKQELNQINTHLPASVYVPFVQNSTRNYCVLHIPTGEARVFQTKERAPIMLCIEVFRPEEMLVELKQMKKGLSVGAKPINKE